MRKTLILDCDGVLYPLTDIPNEIFIQIFRDAVYSMGITKEQYERASALSLERRALGMFNFAREICHDYGVDFEQLCDEFVRRMDYSRLTFDEKLLALIRQAEQKYDLAIYTNNHIKHLDKVLNAKFGLSSETIGFTCFDITSTLFNDIFHPKKSDLGLLMVAEKLGRLPEDCILIDDAEINCHKAESIGMGAVLITDSYTLKDCLRDMLKKS